ncbi:MAG: tetratricopeptide repeat protein [Corynebacteriales bacterium]|nr:tetratricopeptide repeat protein [Mycobacteriales bacterium]
MPKGPSGGGLPPAFGRAIDLSTLNKPAAPVPASAHAIEITEASFPAEVMQRSLATPVVVEFWASWAEPSAQLSPLLDRLAGEANGAWVLARINVDTEQRLAAAFGVQNVPTIAAVVGGQPVDLIAGAVPEAQLRQWLTAIGQAAASAGIGSAPEPVIDPHLAKADELFAAGDMAGAEAAYQDVLRERPADEAAISGLATVALLRRVETVDADEALRAAPDDLEAQLVAADVEIASGHAPAGYARLVGVVKRTTGADRERARTRLLELFTIAAPDDAEVNKARRDLASALF